MESNAHGLAQPWSHLYWWAYDHVLAEPVLNLYAYFLERGRLEDVLAEPRERRVLEVGCGGGHFAIRLKERHSHLSVAAIDLDAGQIARARQRARGKGCSIDFEAADAQALPFPESSFDVVFSVGSAKYWPDPLKGIGECWRVLKPGGELLITDATSDTTAGEVANLFRIVRLPKLLEKALSGRFYRSRFHPSRSMEIYHQIATRLRMPEGAVCHLPSMPVFFFRTRKPLPQPAP